MITYFMLKNAKIIDPIFMLKNAKIIDYFMLTNAKIIDSILCVGGIVQSHSSIVQPREIPIGHVFRLFSRHKTRRQVTYILSLV